ncbi:archease [Candidatus Woesearchaeota archaeon]|nr:archease [Candidatus Woesearchaeota archaeon]
MKPYEFLPHTADTKFRAYGKTLEEAFTNAAYAMTDVITDHTKIKPTIEKNITVTSENEESLLYDFLEQFLILIDSESFLLNQVKELTIKNNKLTAKLTGDTHPEKYEINIVIKAVTYQEMFIKKEKGQYAIQVIVDI